MTAKVNRRFANRDPLYNCCIIDCVCQLEAVAITVDGDVVTVSPCEGAGATQQSATGKLPHVEAVVVFAQSVVRYSGHINRSQFSVCLGKLR